MITVSFTYTQLWVLTLNINLAVTEDSYVTPNFFPKIKMENL